MSVGDSGIMDASSDPAGHLTIFRRVRNGKSQCAVGGKEGRAVFLDLAVLVRYFVVPLEMAARELHICSSALKK